MFFSFGLPKTTLIVSPWLLFFSLPAGLWTWNYSTLFVMTHFSVFVLLLMHQRQHIWAKMHRGNDNKKRWKPSVTVTALKCSVQAADRASKVPTGLAKSRGTVWNGAYVLQSSDRMEHVCTVPQAAGLMLSHLPCSTGAALCIGGIFLPHSNHRPELDVQNVHSDLSQSHRYV